MQYYVPCKTICSLDSIPVALTLNKVDQLPNFYEMQEQFFCIKQIRDWK